MTPGSDDAWQSRVDAQWRLLDVQSPETFITAIDAIAAERPDDAAALLERAAARDSTGLEEGAEGYYRAALAAGRLDPYREMRARIELASTLRILGRLDESERLLVDALAAREGHEGPQVLHDELRAILALTWIAQGRPAEAAALALLTLAPHLTRYARSMTANAQEILENARAS